MLANLALGTLLIVSTSLIHTVGLIAITHSLSHVTGRMRMHRRRSRVVAMMTVVLGLFALLSVEVWIWAGTYLMLDTVGDLETALYLSTVTFSTVGYGDVVPSHGWRLFTALEGVNGFLLIGWSTAYLIAAGIRVGPFRAGEHF